MKWKPLASELISMRGKTIFNAAFSLSFFTSPVLFPFHVLHLAGMWISFWCAKERKRNGVAVITLCIHSGAAAIAAVVAATTMTMTEMAKKPPTKKEIWSKEMMAAKTIKLKWASVKLERSSSTTTIAAHCHKTADSAEAVPIVLHDHVIVCVLLWMCLSSVFMRWVGWWDSHSHTHTTLHKIPPLVYCFAHAIHFCNGKICSKHSKK